MRLTIGLHIETLVLVRIRLLRLVVDLARQILLLLDLISVEYWIHWLGFGRQQVSLVDRELGGAELLLTVFNRSNAIGRVVFVVRLVGSIAVFVFVAIRIAGAIAAAAVGLKSIWVLKRILPAHLRLLESVRLLVKRLVWVKLIRLLQLIMRLMILVLQAIRALVAPISSLLVVRVSSSRDREEIRLVELRSHQLALGDAARGHGRARA